MKNSQNYYLGLDIGTDSIGYAVTNKEYALLKFKGEPMWGATLFESAKDASERRLFRTGRRRLDRRQARVNLLNELFAKEIGKIDPKFFIRRRESALYKEDARFGVALFNGQGITDKEYYEKYPTIHHLIDDLMKSDAAHDVRLVYLACAWLVAHRGHFLLDVDPEKAKDVLDFQKAFDELNQCLENNGYALPWADGIEAEKLFKILQKRRLTEKEKEIIAELKPDAKGRVDDEKERSFKSKFFAQFLAGRKIKAVDLFENIENEKLSFSVAQGDDELAPILTELGDNRDIVLKVRALTDCAHLAAVMEGSESVSQAKIKVYDQHKEDLAYLKSFVKKYLPEQYDDLFKNVVKKNDNYVSYSKNVKRLKGKELEELKFVNQEVFCEGLHKALKVAEGKVSEEDLPAFLTMKERLEANDFLPKQKTGDNRLIPYQLYYVELTKLLDRAAQYLPFLNEADADGITTKEKIVQTFAFRIPYFVGPLKEEKDASSKNAWLVRKAKGRILPWTFEKLVDFEKCEEAFINRMTNNCTYLPWEEVLPENSLLYCEFKVLNELNNLKVNGELIPVDVKEELYENLFKKIRNVNVKKIKDYLKSRGRLKEEDELSGIDVTIKSSLKSYHDFKQLLDSKTLSESDVEDIIKHAAYTEDKRRMRKWLTENYKELSDKDVQYISRLDLKGFGRLSREFLNGREITGTFQGVDADEYTIIEWMRKTNLNLMQLLSEKFTFREKIDDYVGKFYENKGRTLEEELDAAYVSNAVKRQIYRALAVVDDVKKALKRDPEKIFVEMARGGTPDQKGKRTTSRLQQLHDLYAKIKTEDVRTLRDELKSMLSRKEESKLQSKRLYLYYLQEGKCAYTGEPIDLKSLSSERYDIDHIYPQRFVKDDSVLNNMVLVKSEENGRKSDVYPIAPEIRAKMTKFWKHLRDVGLMTEDKYRRLTRATEFTDDERYGFINRQLVETRQSTKVVANLLKKRFPESEIVYVKAGLVSEFRQEFDLPKSRLLNDLHHAKDAYLNVVVGNVYDRRFSKQYFSKNDKNYNVQVGKLFKRDQSYLNDCYWEHERDLALVRKTMAKNAVHLTQFTLCRKGGLFDQQPLKKKEGLVPLKKGLPTVKYGGYNGKRASYFVLAQCEVITPKKTTKEVVLVPIHIIDVKKFENDPEYAMKYVTNSLQEQLSTAKTKPQLNHVQILRKLPIKTLFSLDGTIITLSGKSNNSSIGLRPFFPLLLDHESTLYIKRIESFLKKLDVNPNLIPNKDFDHVSEEENVKLYDRLIEKLESWPFNKIPNNISPKLKERREKFVKPEVPKKNTQKESQDPLSQQIKTLQIILLHMGGKTDRCNLTTIGGTNREGGMQLSVKLSNWKYADVRILDRSTTGLFEKRSENLKKGQDEQNSNRGPK
ncbi:MAG: type II CRISPR RNA-guided endonuclease Cas9 [Thermoguttaceae bacterium]